MEGGEKNEFLWLRHVGSKTRQCWDLFGNMLGFFLIYFIFGIIEEILFTASHPCGTTTMEPVNTPPRRQWCAEVSLGRRYATAVEIAMAAPSEKKRLPKDVGGPSPSVAALAPNSPQWHGKIRTAQTGDTQELNLSNKTS